MKRYMFPLIVGIAALSNSSLSGMFNCDISIQYPNQNNEIELTVNNRNLDNWTLKIAPDQYARFQPSYECGSEIEDALRAAFLESVLADNDYFSNLEKTEANKKIIAYLYMIKACERLSLSYETDDVEMSLQDYYNNSLIFAAPLEIIYQYLKGQLDSDLQTAVTDAATGIKTLTLPSYIETRGEVKEYINTSSDQVFEAIKLVIMNYIYPTT